MSTGHKVAPHPQKRIKFAKLVKLMEKLHFLIQPTGSHYLFYWQPTYLFSINDLTIHKVLRTREGSLDHKVASRPQKWLRFSRKHQKYPQEAALSTLVGGPTAIILAINYSIFIE